MLDLRKFHLDFFQFPQYISATKFDILGSRPTAGHAALDRRIGVRIPASQPKILKLIIACFLFGKTLYPPRNPVAEVAWVIYGDFLMPVELSQPAFSSI